MKMQGIGVCSAVSLMPKVVPPPTDPTDEETELPSDEDIEEMEDGSRCFFLVVGYSFMFFFLSICFFPQNAIQFYVFGIFKYFPCTKIGMSRDISGMFHPSKWNNMRYFFFLKYVPSSIPDLMDLENTFHFFFGK